MDAFARRDDADHTMRSTNVQGSGRVRWPDRDWGAASGKPAVERVDPVRKVAHDPRVLDPVAEQFVPRLEGNPFDPRADRSSTNGYDHIMDSLRTAALKRDAALAGGPARPAADARPGAFADEYVRNAIAAYERNSRL
jgi:hypothetical protein